MKPTYNNAYELIPEAAVTRLAFSGGGIRSYSQIAFLEALEEASVPIHAVSGTSMGCVIATLHAMGLDAHSIEAILLDAEDLLLRRGDFKNPLLKLLIPHYGGNNAVVDSASLISFYRGILEKYHLPSTFDALIKPVAICSVDLLTARIVIFTNDPTSFVLPPNSVFYEPSIDLPTAMAASCAYPLAISPVHLDGYRLIDGGVRINVPVEVFPHEPYSQNLAVYQPSVLSTPGPAVEPLLRLATRAVEIMGYQLEMQQFNHADYAYAIPANASAFTLGKGRTVIDEARAYVQLHPLPIRHIRRP
ncbi:MAG: patatin-like phospholipase family protein [Ndongobacter sp.]|nr:patatin-like phospholipase family protein [Ndongobacter sp.]